MFMAGPRRLRYAVRCCGQTTMRNHALGQSEEGCKSSGVSGGWIVLSVADGPREEQGTDGWMQWRKEQTILPHLPTSNRDHYRRRSVDHFSFALFGHSLTRLLSLQCGARLFSHLLTRPMFLQCSSRLLVGKWDLVDFRKSAY